MKPELELKIKNMYPELFTNMLRPHFEFSNGWYILFSDLCDELSKYSVSIVLAKEKFGGLRVYTESDADVFDKISDIVSKAENKSYFICESCGCQGKVREGGWIRTLCDGCVLKPNQDRYA